MSDGASDDWFFMSPSEAAMASGEPESDDGDGDGDWEGELDRSLRLWQAIESHSLSDFEALLPISNPRLRLEGRYGGLNALEMAFAVGFEPAALALLALNDPKLLERPEGAASALFLAARADSGRLVRIALALPGMDPNERFEGLTPLLETARGLRVSALGALTSASDLSARGPNGYDAIMMALSKAGQRPSGFDEMNEGARALDAEIRERALAAAIGALAPLIGGANRDFSGKTALMIAAKLPEPFASAAIKELLPVSDAGAESDEGAMAFEWALSAGNLATAARVAHPGKARYFASRDSKTQLMMAVEHQAYDAIKALLPHSDPLQRRWREFGEGEGVWGQSAVDLALEGADCQALMEMLPGFDPLAVCGTGELSVLAEAFKRVAFDGKKGLERFLEACLERPLPERMTHRGELALSLACGSSQWSERLFERFGGADVSDHGATSLMGAAQGSWEWVERLAQLVDPSLRDRWGRTALMWAAMGESEEAVDSLASASDCAAQDQNGDTALHLAVARGSARMARKLAQKGAVGVKNNNGQTAFLAAAEQGELAVALELARGFGADALDRDASGRDVFDLALTNARTGAVSWGDYQTFCLGVAGLMGRLPVSAQGESLERRSAKAYRGSPGPGVVEVFFAALEQSLALEATIATPGRVVGESGSKGARL